MMAPEAADPWRRIVSDGLSGPEPIRLGPETLRMPDGRLITVRDPREVRIHDTSAAVLAPLELPPRVVNRRLRRAEAARARRRRR